LRAFWSQVYWQSFDLPAFQSEVASIDAMLGLLTSLSPIFVDTVIQQTISAKC
jgi:hypothetical protein